MSLSVLLLVFLLSLGSIYASDVFYIIAHGTNTINAVDWAIEQGANAVELDLDFTRSGQLRAFTHGSPCDCSCRCPFPFTNLCLNNQAFSCFPLREEFSNPCQAEARMEQLLPYVASRTEIALTYIDSKLEDDDNLEVAGTRVLQALETLLFGNGYTGEVIIGAFAFSQVQYLRSAVFRSIVGSPFGDRIFFSLELGSLNRLFPSVPILQALRPSEIDPPVAATFGTGITSCAPIPLDRTTLELAAINKARGAISLAYTWTTDCTNYIVTNLDYANAIITNYPSRVRAVITGTGRKLATTSDRLPTIKTQDLVVNTAAYDCECDYRSGGCIIRFPTLSGLACKCELSPTGNVQLCSGKMVLCRDSENPKCVSPDTSLESCQQGGGNCGGYR